MPIIEYAGKQYQTESQESVLDTLLRNGVEVNYGCQAGACQACLLKLEEGSVSQRAQQGLKDTQQQQGYFMACSCYPEDDLVLSQGESVEMFSATLVEHVKLSDEVVGISLKSEPPLSYRAGQFINIHHPDGAIRSYSLASIASIDENLLLHVRRVSNGLVSNWLHDQVSIGDQLTLSGPSGECFYTASQPQQPLLMIGSGTGLAPLYGILRDALQQGHQGEIHLFHGSRDAAGLYLVDELKAIAEQYPQFSYTPSLSGEDQGHSFQHGRALDLALKQYSSLKGFRIYLCGNELMVKQAKKQAFLAGANMSDIFADPFTFS